MSQGYYQLAGGRVASIDGPCPFPPLHDALTDPNGLIAIGGDLSVERLLMAYRQGIFPWFNDDEPILWWSPDPRMVLFPQELHITRSLSKTIRSNTFEVRYNTTFREVITACSQIARPQQPGTWITQSIIEAYCRLHKAGYAISAETWLNDQLVGGCYGVKIGRMFYGESMFHQVTDASKVAFAHLVQKLQTEHVGMIDCQMKTAHLTRFGAREISRENFAQALAKLVNF